MENQDNLREALETAISQEETGALAPAASERVEPAEKASSPTPYPSDETGAGKPVEPEKSTPEGAKPAESAAPTETPPEEVEAGGKPLNYDKPPSSWKPIGKAKWNELPLEARQEVTRRERQITQTLSDTAAARGFVERYEKTLQPFQAHIQARGVTDQVEMVKALVQTDYVLSTAPAPQRAAFMAKLIKDYGIDIAALDSALAGEPVGDPVQTKVEQLLAQRLAPLQQFLAQQQQASQQQELQSTAKVQETIESMAQDTEKYPYFEDVREDMADLIEMNAKRGVYLTLEQAYSRAVVINPDTSKLVQSQSQAQQSQRQASAANARAQKALNASVSVSGSPNGSGGGGADPGNLRGTIAAAFESASGR